MIVIFPDHTHFFLLGFGDFFSIFKVTVVLIEYNLNQLELVYKIYGWRQLFSLLLFDML